MKKEYIRPTIEVENFVVNEYVAACAVNYTCNSNKLDPYLHWENSSLTYTTSKPMGPNFTIHQSLKTKDFSPYLTDSDPRCYLIKCNDYQCQKSSKSDTANSTCNGGANTMIGTSTYAWIDDDITYMDSVDNPVISDVPVRKVHVAEYVSSNAPS